MSILINGMKMPKNCMLCNFCVEEADPANGEMCLVTGKLMPPCNHERLDDCPLIEVPPHGDLVDINALKFAILDGDYANEHDYLKGVLIAINHATTVIESDKDGET